MYCKKHALRVLFACIKRRFEYLCVHAYVHDSHRRAHRAPSFAL